MKGNALEPENYQRLLQARWRLAVLKTVKLNRRAKKYENQSASLHDLMNHLNSETVEAFDEYARSCDDIDFKALAFEIADVSNCCDLIITEILDKLDKPKKNPRPDADSNRHA